MVGEFGLKLKKNVHKRIHYHSIALHCSKNASKLRLVFQPNQSTYRIFNKNLKLCVLVGMGLDESFSSETWHQFQISCKGYKERESEGRDFPSVNQSDQKVVNVD